MNEGIGLRQLLDYYYVLCDFYKVYQKSSKTHPSSLTLKGGSTAFPKPLFNGLYTPFGSPVSGGQKPSLTVRKAPHPNQAFPSRKGKDVTALRCSEPLRFMVVGPSKVYAMLCGMGPPGVLVGIRVLFPVLLLLVLLPLQL